MNSEERTLQEVQNDEQLKIKRKLFMKIFTIIIVICAILYGIYWWFVSSYYETTDNAYVSGNVLPISSQINGIITQVNTEDTQSVLSGETLVELDPTNYQTAFNEARENLANTLRSTLQTYLNNDGLEATISERQVTLNRAKQDLVRRSKAISSGAISREELNHARDTLKSAEASLTQAISALDANLALTINTHLQRHPNVMIAATRMRQNYIDLMRTKIRAPYDGIVAKKSAQIGQQISTGTSLMAVVPLNQIWVDANFKETQLRNIRIGQPVSIVSDIYGSSVEYHGTVIGLSAGTGSAFALLPAQNATGNWIKVVQRLPVRIALDQKELARYPLRIGLSMTATVNTHDSSGKLTPDHTVKTQYKTSLFDNINKEAEQVVIKTIRENMGLLSQLEAVSHPDKAVQQPIKTESRQ